MAIDLDAARAARAAKREAEGRKPEVVHKGKTFELPTELPYETVPIIALIQREDFSGVTRLMQILIGDRWDEFEGLGFSIPDLEVLGEALLDEYDLKPDESPGENGAQRADPSPASTPG